MKIKIFPSSVTEVFILELPFLNSVASFDFSVRQLRIPFVILFEEELLLKVNVRLLLGH